MRSPTLVFGSLLAISYAISIPTVEKRDAASIISAVKNIQSKVVTLNSTLSGFNYGDIDGLMTVLTIQQQSTGIGDAVKSAIKAAQASAAFPADTATETPNNQVAAAVLSLKACLQSFLTTLQSKKPAFDGVLVLVSVSKTIEQTLKQQRASSKQLGDCISAKLASPYKDMAPLITGQIDGFFEQAISTFAEEGGIISLPAISFKA